MFYRQVVSPPLLCGHFPVCVKEGVLGDEDQKGLPVLLHQPVDVVQGHALVLDPVEAVEGEHLGEAAGQPEMGQAGLLEPV